MIDRFHYLNIRTLLLPLLVVLAGFVGQAQAGDDPQAELKGAIDQIIAVLGDKGMNEADKRSKIGTIVDSRFDYRAMSQRVLTGNNWRQATSAEKDQFSELFGLLLKNTYFSAISAYSDQSVNFKGSEIKGKKHNRAKVETEIVSADKRIPVIYWMRLKKSGWYVYDVNVEGVSLTTSHRSTFLNVFKNEGMAGAIKTLEEKVNSK